MIGSKVYMSIRDGVKSTERVKKFGEVFTPNSIVNEMLDMIDEQIHKDNDSISYIKKTYLEPACGDGQFLIVVLERKLNEVNKLPVELRQYGFIISFCTIYGVDIQEDNVAESIERMYKIANGETVETFDLNSKTNKIKFTPDGFDITDDMLKTVRYILNNNIVCGDTIKTDNTNSILLFDYSLNDTDQTISIKTDLLNDEDQICMLRLANIIVGENIQFDKLYTLRDLKSFKSGAGCENITLELEEEDFEF